MGDVHRGNFRIIVVLLVVFGLMFGAWYWWQRGVEGSAQSAESEAGTPEMISLQAENRMMKVMLGQVEGVVAVLGPVGTELPARGKVAWDQTLQQGYFYASHLAADTEYELWGIGLARQRVSLGLVRTGEDGRVGAAFRPAERLLQVELLELTTPGENGQPVLEGRPLGARP